MTKKLLLLSSVAAAFFYGVIVGVYQVFPYYLMQDAKNYFATTTPAIFSDSVTIGYDDLANKEEVACEDIDMTNTMVALAFGQSNSANAGETRFASTKPVFNFYKGRCFKAVDPLLGATSDQGSAWTRLGDMLVDSGLFDNVIFVTIGVGSTSISRWKSDGDLFQRIVNAKTHLDQQQLKLTHLLWHQGESDGLIGTSKQGYKAMFVDMVDGIRRLGVDAPLYLAVATRCRGPAVEEIQQAQLELAEEREDVLMGPNTDTISDMDDRHDFCHFSHAGLRKHAALWLEALKKSDI